MIKSAEAFRTISEAAEELDLPQHVLRFWETRFPQIKPLKRAGGRRFYRPADVLLLTTIRQLLYAEGYTIRGVQRLLKEQGVKAIQAGSRPDPAFLAEGQADEVRSDGGGLDADLSNEDASGSGAGSHAALSYAPDRNLPAGTPDLSVEARLALEQALGAIVDCERILLRAARAPLKASEPRKTGAL